MQVSVTEDVIRDIKTKGTKSELLKTWKFGCERDPSQVSEKKGCGATSSGP
jgi:hypothetical protein